MSENFDRLLLFENGDEVNAFGIDLADVDRVSTELLEGHAGANLPVGYHRHSFDTAGCDAALIGRILQGLTFPMTDVQLQAMLADAHRGSTADKVVEDVSCRCTGANLKEHPLHLILAKEITLQLRSGELVTYHELDHPFRAEIKRCEDLILIGRVKADATRLRGELMRTVLVGIEPRLQPRSGTRRAPPLMAFESGAIARRDLLHESAYPHLAELYKLIADSAGSTH